MRGSSVVGLVRLSRTRQAFLLQIFVRGLPGLVEVRVAFASLISFSVAHESSVGLRLWEKTARARSSRRTTSQVLHRLDRWDRCGQMGLATSDGLVGHPAGPSSRCWTDGQMFPPLQPIWKLCVCLPLPHFLYTSHEEFICPSVQIEKIGLVDPPADDSAWTDPSVHICPICPRKLTCERFGSVVGRW